MIEYFDVVLGLSYGDEGKGAVVYNLSKRDEYTHVMRTSGGTNAGHTIYHEGKKFVTHIIPTGIFHGKKCIIGSGCVINVRKFFEEIAALEGFGIKTHKKIIIAPNAHVVTEEHISEESSESKIGTTKQGIGPAYRDKYDRTGIQAKDVPELRNYIEDLYDYFYNNGAEMRILCEGAQGFNLDIDWGDYPFVTSSHCTLAGALLNGLPVRRLRKVYGCAKAYDTYVGSKKFEPDEPEFELLRKYGNEFGATTGRPRQCNWLDMRSLIKAIEMNSCTHVIISKVDIMRQLNAENDDLHWCVKVGNNVRYCDGEADWAQWIYEEIQDLCETVQSVTFRDSPMAEIGEN